MWLKTQKLYIDMNLEKLPKGNEKIYWRRYWKNYYQENKDKRKKYYQENKDVLKEKARIYWYKKREHNIMRKRKEYLEKSPYKEVRT